MPEDVRIFGADTHIPRKTFPWALGGAALVAFLAFRSRPSQSANPTVAAGIAGNTAQANADSLEFYRIQQQAATDLAQLMGANKLEMQAQEYQYNLAQSANPASQKMCIPLSTWYGLDNATRQSFQGRVNNGQLVETIGPDGICFTPTQQGLMGYMPYVRTSSKQGLFGGSYSVTGPANATAGTSAAPQAPSPSIFAFLESILRAFNQPIF
jgi:hypothetical protein